MTVFAKTRFIVTGIVDVGAVIALPGHVAKYLSGVFNPQRILNAGRPVLGHRREQRIVGTAESAVFVDGGHGLDPLLSQLWTHEVHGKPRARLQPVLMGRIRADARHGVHTMRRPPSQDVSAGWQSAHDQLTYLAALPKILEAFVGIDRRAKPSDFERHVRCIRKMGGEETLVAGRIDREYGCYGLTLHTQLEQTRLLRHGNAEIDMPFVSFIETKRDIDPPLFIQCRVVLVPR